MRTFGHALVAISLAALAFQPAAPADAAGSGNWMRDHVRQREAAMIERTLGKEAARRFLARPEIVGGQPAPGGRWRAQVGLLFASEPDNREAQFCGGSLIHKRYVLTAAHCVDFLAGPAAIEVLTGTQSLAAGGTRRAVQSITIHPKWDDDTFDYDIALVRLAAPVTGIPVNFLVTRANEPVLAAPGTRAMVTGWGNTGPVPPSFPVKLHQVKVPLVQRPICNSPASYNGEITLRMVCAGYKAGGKDSCQGDSGGPLVVPNAAGKWRFQVGVVSWGDGCAVPNLYGVYTRLAVLNAWVKKTIATGRSLGEVAAK